MLILDRARVLAALFLVSLVVSGCGGADSPPTTAGAVESAPPAPATERGSTRSFDLRGVAQGLNRPTWAGYAPGDAGALWVLEQPGRVIRQHRGRRTIALDLAGRVKVGAEQGLLGIAFHPAFASNRLLYVHFSDRRGDTRVDEFRVAASGRHIVPKPVRTILQVRQPEDNHNGGHLAFGPDGRLYLGLGDGGGAFDPRRTAQDDSLLGKLIAADVGDPRPRWAIVLRGLRNPWRFAFDPALGEVWIGDVGQDHIEEVNRVPLELDEPPKNLGWSVYEGTERVREGKRTLGPGELVWPAAIYRHDAGCSITGGLVYTGVGVPAMGRRYLYGDFCTGILWSLRASPGNGAEDVRRERAKVPQLTHIGTDEHGELLLVSGSGAVYRAVAAGS